MFSRRNFNGSLKGMLAGAAALSSGGRPFSSFPV
jgi:hypothetical protein